MYRVVANNNDGGGALELVPNFPTVHRNRNAFVRQQQHQPADKRKDLISFDENFYHDQRVYRLHFSIVDKNRSWMRGTKRSIRWYVQYFFQY
jgi:hypothetical protein